METKFTPGPWSIDGVRVVHGDKPDDERADVRRLVALPYGGDTEQLIGGGESVRERWDANAHLIAAAPDLYEACQLALGYWYSDHPNDTVDAEQARAKIAAALAKARGEAE